MWAFLVVISLLVFAGSLVGLLFKGTRGKAKRYAWMSALAMFFAVGFFASEQDDEARRMGFVDNDDRRATTEAGVTDAATWRAAKEAKKQEQQDSSLQEANAVRSGRAKICATRDVEFDSFREIRLPAKTVFQDLGPLTGAARDPWKPGGASDSRRAGFLTADPVTLTKAAPCAESGVRMLVGGLFKEPVARVADRRVWQIEDVLDYSPTPAPPPVEFGKLIDDMSVQAELLSDAGDPLILPKQKADEKDEAAKCLTEAQKMAAHEGGVVGRQTGSVVFISHPAASEFSFGCSVDGIKPDVFVAWNKARPRPSTVKLISSAGAFLTGAPIEDIKRELNRCIGDALKPDAGELANREFDGGVRVECQAFERDGGGGSVTIVRRFGSYPVHDMPSAKSLDDMKRASAALAAVEHEEAEKSLEAARWWEDPAIPKKVKAFVIIAARVQALAERCPSWKPDGTVVTNAASSAGVSVQNIKPGGRYFATFADMLAGMRKGTQEETREEACATAKKSYGEGARN
jgi:hypothetical protein